MGNPATPAQLGDLTTQLLNQNGIMSIAIGFGADASGFAGAGSGKIYISRECC